jgi:hypothetical protein
MQFLTQYADKSPAVCEHGRPAVARTGKGSEQWDA